jgi:hypothetical protein
VSLVCFALAAASLSIFTIVNLDMGFHLRAGELIWETARIPTQDIFSYVAEGRRWVDSQWLFQTVIYGAHTLAGIAGLVGRLIDTQLRRLGVPVAAPMEEVGGLRQRVVMVLLCSLAVLFNAFQLYRELRGEVSWFPPLYELLPTLERELRTVLSPLVFFRVLVALSALAMAACWRSLRLGDLLPYAVFLYLSLEAARNVPLFVIAALPITARCLRELTDRLPGRRRPSAGAIAIGTALSMIAVTGCIVVGTTSGALYRHLGWRRSFGIGDSRELPSPEMLSRLRGVKGRILNDPHPGGFLIWRLYPEKQVAVDGRWEVYGELLPGVRKTFHDRTAFLHFASRYGVDAVVVQKRSGIARLTPRMMRSIPDFRLTLETPNTLLYERVLRNPPVTNHASESTAVVGTEEVGTAVQP